MRSEASQTMASTDGCVRGERVVGLQSKESEHIHLCDVAGVCLLGACFLCAQDRRSSGRHSGLPPDLVLALDLFSLSHSFSAFLIKKISQEAFDSAVCEAMDALGLESQEAVDDTVETLQQQGYDLSRVQTDAPPPGGRQELTAATKAKKLAHKVSEQDHSSNTIQTELIDLVRSLRLCLVRHLFFIAPLSTSSGNQDTIPTST